MPFPAAGAVSAYTVSALASPICVSSLPFSLGLTVRQEMPAQKPFESLPTAWIVTSGDAQFSAAQKQIFVGGQDAADLESPRLSPSNPRKHCVCDYIPEFALTYQNTPNSSHYAPIQPLRRIGPAISHQSSEV